ncbi:MAG TPA: TonB family protein [Candidatus Acidoferrum sp.]|nr:TonB family protein [Candidatus Acidoferrum sp.]
MRDPLLRPASARDSLSDSWFNRIRENLAQLLLPPLKPTSANGAPLHLLQFDKSRHPARAQAASFLVHAALFAAILFFLAQSPRPPAGPNTRIISRDTLLAPFLGNLFSANPSNAGGRGGGDAAIPPTHGNPPPYSSIVLVKPTLPQNRQSQLPVPPTLLDPSAAPILAPTPNLGLPWMTADTRSPGTGKGHSIGSEDGDNMGDRGQGPFGDGDARGPYRPALTFPACAYCPYPTYTDEARHAKVQGAVTLRVLVGADGRAQDIRIIRGIGVGLDDRAVETVRNWKFLPAHDASKRAVPTWVTVEAVFRLF